jgi:hypothetical protein
MARRRDRRPAGREQAADTVPMDAVQLFRLGRLWAAAHADWAARDDFALACTCSVDPARLAINPLEQRIIEPVLNASRDVAAQLTASSGKVATTSCPVLHALGNNLVADAASSHNVMLNGTPTIGVVFSESTAFDEGARERAKRPYIN